MGGQGMVDPKHAPPPEGKHVGILQPHMPRLIGSRVARCEGAAAAASKRENGENRMRARLRGRALGMGEGPPQIIRDSFCKNHMDLKFSLIDVEINFGVTVYT
jgi:hypothetical protein